MTCRGGQCEFPCALGGITCGATCCANHEHCVNDSSCTCVPLQQTCDPSNNLCCGPDFTECPVTNAYGKTNKCCRPRGTRCTTGADCCKDITDLDFGRNMCGSDGICGGTNAFCTDISDCTGNLSCLGACFGPGESGSRICAFDSQCPSGTTCRQRRCIDASTLP
jgi:hypothetical protein